MEEQKKEIEEQKDDTQKPPVPPDRSIFLWIVAGIYLIYTGYTLCRNVLNGQEGAGWGFFIAGAVFIVLGAGMIFFGLKSYHAKMKTQKKAAEAKDEDEPAMSIAERARLANRSEDAQEDIEEDGESE